jgi:hypothetical protein
MASSFCDRLRQDDQPSQAPVRRRWRLSDAI